jgi:hypothetical protein
MSCEVCIGTDDIGDPAELYSQAMVKARIPHRCCECGGQIEAGSRYERSRGRWEGKWFTYRTCLLCQEIRDVFTCGESYFHLGLWEDMREIAFPELTTATDCFQELSPLAKQFVLTRWAEWKGLR